MTAPAPEGTRVWWTLRGATDQASRQVVIDARLAFDATRVAELWLSRNCLPTNLVMARLAPYQPDDHAAEHGLLVVSRRDGDLHERTLTPIEIDP